MLLIECPWCGPRAETEFSYGGEAGIVRPPDPDALSDAEWADYLFYRANPRGAHRELWNHAQGCRRWFGVKRDTVTYRIEDSFILGPTETSGTAGDGIASDARVEAGDELGVAAGAEVKGAAAEIEGAVRAAAGIADGTGTSASVESASTSNGGNGG